MIYVFWAVLGLVVAAAHLRHHRDRRDRRSVLETVLVWWLVIPLGVAAIVGAGFHVFDATGIAEQIGFTQGDGGFHFEVAMADLAIGVICVMCFWIRDRFWLAAILASAIFLIGDGYGHIYQMIEHDNHAADNTGVVLYADFIFPVVAMVLYGLLMREGGPRVLRR
jgi:DMSO reductase anchor subunit